MADFWAWLATNSKGFLDAANLLALIGLALGLLNNARQQKNAARIEQQENYLRLELASVEIFRFEAQYGEMLYPYKQNGDSGEARTRQSDSVADNFYLQQLNLFEVAARFRRGLVFGKDIFGSWVIWFYDAHSSWWFRERWIDDYRDNYTPDLKAIFDVPTAGYDPAISEEDRKRAFFTHVAKVFDCPIILKWLDEKPALRAK